MSVYYSCVYSSSLHFSRTFRTTEPTSLLQYTSHTHVVTCTQSHPALGMRMNGWSFSDRLMLKIQESVLKERCKVDPSSSGTKFYPCFWAMSIRQPYNPKQNKRMFLYFPEELGLSKALNTQTASEVNRNHALNISYPHFPPQVAKVQLSQQLNAYFGRKASRGWQTKLSTFWCSHALKTNKNWHLLLYTLTPPARERTQCSSSYTPWNQTARGNLPVQSSQPALLEGTLQSRQHQPRSLLPWELPSTSSAVCIF